MGFLQKFAKEKKAQEFGREVQEIIKELDRINQRLRDVGNVVGQQGHGQLQSLIEKANDSVRDAWTSLMTAKGLM